MERWIDAGWSVEAKLSRVEEGKGCEFAQRVLFWKPSTRQPFYRGIFEQIGVEGLDHQSNAEAFSMDERKW